MHPLPSFCVMCMFYWAKQTQLFYCASHHVHIHYNGLSGGIVAAARSLCRYIELKQKNYKSFNVFSSMTTVLFQHVVNQSQHTEIVGIYMQMCVCRLVLVELEVLLIVMMWRYLYCVNVQTKDDGILSNKLVVWHWGSLNNTCISSNSNLDQIKHRWSTETKVYKCKSDPYHFHSIILCTYSLSLLRYLILSKLKLNRYHV